MIDKIKIKKAVDKYISKKYNTNNSNRNTMKGGKDMKTLIRLNTLNTLDRINTNMLNMCGMCNMQINGFAMIGECDVFVMPPLDNSSQ